MRKSDGAGAKPAFIKRIKGDGTRHFVAFATIPSRWLDVAKELRRTAAIVGPHVFEDCARTTPPPWPPMIMMQWLMLLSFMLENMLKGLRIAQQPSLVANGKLADELRTHKLRDVANNAGLTLLDGESDVLEFLEYAAVQVGRYPSANKAKLELEETGIDLEAAGEIAERLYRRIGEALVLVQYPPGSRFKINETLITRDEYVDSLLFDREVVPSQAV